MTKKRTMKNHANPFIERSLMGALNFLKEAVFSEEISHSQRFLQRLDPAVKVVGCVLLIIVTSLVRDPFILAGLYLLGVILAVLSGIDLWLFLKRVWVFIPLFALLIAIPAAFMGDIYSAIVFVLRVAASVSFAVLITITTPHARLINSLRKMGFPDIFVRVLDMTYRYIFLFIMVFQDMHMALKARLIKRLSGAAGRSWVAERMGYIYARSVRMSEEVYLAMISRGYTLGKDDEKR